MKEMVRNFGTEVARDKELNLIAFSQPILIEKITGQFGYAVMDKNEKDT